LNPCLIYSSIIDGKENKDAELVVSGGSGKLDRKVFFLSEALPG
jgi:hypothetical protein